jgi:hypothetical protein
LIYRNLESLNKFDCEAKRMEMQIIFNQKKYSQKKLKQYFGKRNLEKLKLKNYKKDAQYIKRNE